MVARTKYEECEIIVGGVNTLVDVTKLGEIKFDIILEMDWLSTHRASVDCYEKKVMLRMDGIPEFTIEGIHNARKTPIILALKASRLLTLQY